MPGPDPSIDHVVTRLYELLCDGEGSENALPQSYFLRGAYPEQTPEEAVALAREKPRAVVTLDSVAPLDVADLRAGHKHVALSLTIRLDYAAPAQPLTSEWVTLYGRVGDDYVKLRRLLESSVNTGTTKAGEATGVAGFIVRNMRIASYPDAGLVRASIQVEAHHRQ